MCTGYCHTTEGAGREAPDLFDCESMHGGSDQEVFTVITGGLPNTQMQAFVRCIQLIQCGVIDGPDAARCISELQLSLVE